MPEAPSSLVREYHARTKHHTHRFAASLGYLDWATQPDPFRTFAGAPLIDLPLSAGRLATVPYDDLFKGVLRAAQPVTRDSVGAFFELALGLSAWKQYEGTRWALRCNPSSGNLHPTEGYAVFPTVDGLNAGVYHYQPRDHQLEQRCALDAEPAEHVTRLLSGTFLAGLSSIHWREAWKYGERAFRYCQHDIGHALASLRFAAAALGWRARLLDLPDAATVAALGLGRLEDFSDIAEADREHPAALLCVGPALLHGNTGDEDPVDEHAAREVVELVSTGSWLGRANSLSSGHVAWPAIDAVADATRKDASARPLPGFPEGVRDVLVRTAPTMAGSLPVAQLIRQRRSAVALDDTTAISAASFYTMLERLLPYRGTVPWDVLPWKPNVHCGILVHRVEGLSPGLYLFVRHLDSLSEVKAALNPQFLFERPAGCPDHLLLFRLESGDFRQKAQLVSCQQKIAGAGAFSLGMIAEFGDSLDAIGPWWYRRLFWEAGVLGQVLYLEAEAAGVRGTGIGCYFDDLFHTILGLKDNRLQSLYHFTVGNPVEDSRLITLPAYAHLGPRDR